METKPEKLNGIYEEIAYMCGVDVALKLYENYRGLQITFPIKFLNPTYIHKEILNKYYDGMSIKELSIKYNYCERYIRAIIKNNQNYIGTIDP